MEFRIADTFTDSLARLTGDEQKAAKTTAFDLQVNPASPGMSFHKLGRAKDKNFWSVRVNNDIRLIVHRTASSLLLCYVDHHDRAYAWAERRKLETHPTTGAAQLVELRETVKEIVVPNYVQAHLPLTEKPAQVALFADKSDDELLGYGVPAEWLSDVRGATEDGLLNVASHLPAEAAEALLELATGGTPRSLLRIDRISEASGPAPLRVPSLAEQRPRFSAAPTPAAFNHPDAQRRFRNITSIEELQRALDYPWDKWTVFLHPDQREIVQTNYAGPARVSGSAGTGKTIVALHRAAYLARTYPDARILLTTFSDTLANALRIMLRLARIRDGACTTSQVLCNLHC
jgi:UvrD/REP helicase N-terminal domain